MRQIRVNKREKVHDLFEGGWSDLASQLDIPAGEEGMRRAVARSPPQCGVLGSDLTPYPTSFEVVIGSDLTPWPYFIRGRHKKRPT